jgi:hypothetical protein
VGNSLGNDSDSPANSEPDSTIPAESTSTSNTNEADSMSIEGEITGVMETWPLQLTVETANESYQVSLEPDTAITQDGQVIEAGQLSPGQAVTILGTLSPSESNAMVAESIEIE